MLNQNFVFKRKAIVYEFFTIRAESEEKALEELKKDPLAYYYSESDPEVYDDDLFEITTENIP